MEWQLKPSYDFEIIHVSETYFDVTTITGYSLIGLAVIFKMTAISYFPML